MLPEARIQALEDVATRLRIDSIRATTAAKSGHPSSAASAADLVAAIFFDAMRLDADHPRAVTSDRFVLSKGHAAPVLYAAWAEVGALKREELTTLRNVDSDLEGHPTPRLPFVDVATGSLGQGLGVGIGLALGARLAGAEARVFVLLGDGETAEGAVWEAAQMAGHRALDNLIAIVDVNALGQSGPTMLGHDLDAYRRRFVAFGWRAQTVDGHDVPQIVAALRRARRPRGAPSAIIARTVKGKGIEGVEGLAGWHGKALPADAAERTVAALESRLHHVPAGLAAQGLIPFASSFACFLTRAADQVRMAGISRSNVKLCGSHAGVSIGEDGPSQMALEDLALFRAVPDAVVLYPGDGVATDACVQLAAGLPRP